MYSQHFEDYCFDGTGQKVRLNPNTEASIFNFPEYLMKLSDMFFFIEDNNEKPLTSYA